MKRKLCCVTLSSLFGLSVALVAGQAQNQTAPANSAQQYGHRQADPDRQLKMLSKRLNLSAEQQAQISPILSARQQEIENVRSDASLSAQDRHAKMQGIRDESESKIKAVLNDQQRTTYEQLQQQMRERRQQHRGEQEKTPGQGTAVQK